MPLQAFLKLKLSLEDVEEEKIFERKENEYVNKQ